MLKMAEKHFVLLVCAAVVALCLIIGGALAIVGVAVENREAMFAGVNVAIWPVLLFLIGVGLNHAY